MNVPKGLWLVVNASKIRERQRQLGDDWHVMTYRTPLIGRRADRIVLEDHGYMMDDLGDARFLELTDECRKRLGANPQNLILA